MSKVETFLRKILVFIEKIDTILMNALRSIYKLLKGVV